jgi:drug/metabolite transporter (DMT)-like permease
MGTANCFHDNCDMNTAATILWVLCLCIETIAQLAFKASASQTAGVSASNMAHWKAMLSNLWIWIGVACYVVEFFLYMAFLSLVPLAQGVLICSISIMTIMIGGRIFFAEKLSRKRIVAGMLIAIGVSMVGWG